MNNPSSEQQPDKERRPLRPLHGIPEPDKRGKEGAVLSALFHILVFLLLLLPPLVATQLDLPLTGGAGGDGPAGGGGGGSRGSGGARVVPERIQYMDVAPEAAPTTVPTSIPEVTTTPVEEPIPEVIPPPVLPPPEEPVSRAASPSIEAVAPVPGSGGGTGRDGSAGTGPGSGGGTGSGVGTGTGSGVGPGTGGGSEEIYPPQVTNLAILPIPVPARVRPYKLVAYFEVDEKGNSKLLSFNPSRDSGYNRKIREMLAEVRFRPAVRADGTPVRDTTWITAEAPR